MPHVAIKTGFFAPDGREEELAEYLCDWTDCPNTATQPLGCSKELGLTAAVCDEHAAPPVGIRAPTEPPPPEPA